MMRVRLAVLALAVVVGAGGMPRTAAAQDVQWTTWTKVELGGALGTMARLFGGKMESTEKNYIKGTAMRMDAEKRSSIVDLGDTRFIDIDHDSKTYSVVTMAQLTEYMNTAAAQARAQAQAGGAAAAERQAQGGNAQSDVEVRLDIKVDRTGEKQRIQSYEAERVLLTAQSDFLVEPEAGGEKQPAGKLVILMDSWHAANVPAEEAMKRMAEEAGPAMRAQSAEAAGSFMGMLTQDPKAMAAMEKAAKEMEKLAGFEMKGTMHIVLVPPGLEFDREMALADEKGGGGAKPSAKGILGGMLRNAAGVREEKPPEQENTDPRQYTIARVRSEVRDMKTGNLNASLFQPPSGYREITWNQAGGR